MSKVEEFLKSQQFNKQIHELAKGELDYGKDTFKQQSLMLFANKEKIAPSASDLFGINHLF